MFGIKRWDPASRAGLEAPTSAPASHIDLNAKIAEKRGRKRKRLQDDEEVPRALPATSLVLPNSVTPAHASPLAATPADPTPTAGSAAQSESRRAKARVSFGYTGGNAVPLPTEPVAKTKAKQRYLRKKRERRKARDRSSGSASGGLDASPQVDVPGPGDDRTASAPKEGLLSEKRIASRRLRSPQDEESTGAGPPLRSRNRPKNLDDALRRAQLHASVTSKRDSHKDLPPSATHPGALPSFPEPRRPEAPDVALLSRLARGLGDEDDEDEAQEIRIDPGSAADVDVLAAPIGPGPRLLSSRTVDRLKEIGISTLFAVQSAVVPLLLGRVDPECPVSSLYSTAAHRDVCITAPTGSGKTLSYVIPIVEALRLRTVPRLRALVVVPTKDLVHQVGETFADLVKGTSLRVVALSGQQPLAHEKAAIAASDSALSGPSGVDVVITTPGRLLDHVDAEPGLSLQHLRFLVFDEADRIMSQSFHHSLARIESLLNRRGAPCGPASDPLPSHHVEGPRHTMPQKLLFSATLGHDPSKLAAVNLHRPVFIAVRDDAVSEAPDSKSFQLPSTLTEFYAVTDLETKPLALCHLLKAHSINRALCFCKSVEAATRLSELLKLFTAAGDTKMIVESLSSDLPGAQRTKLLAAFQRGEIQLLICSDLVARGVDVPDVPSVINYDAPVDLRKYVHRVGRTARAGKNGTAWTLVERQEAVHFKRLLRDLGRADAKQVRLSAQALRPLEAQYQVALAQLARRFGRGSNTAT